MDFMRDFFELQEKMYKSFQDMYGVKKEEEKEFNYGDKIKEFFDMQMKMAEGFTGGKNPFTMFEKFSQGPGYSFEDYKNF